MKTTSFLRGMGAGMVAGAAIAALAASKGGAMHTAVGRKLRRASCAMDAALYDFLHSMR